MAELKTKATNQSPTAYIATIEPQEKQKDALELLKMYTEITGEKPVIWGTSIIGFGQYHYKSERSTQEGDWPLVGFSPRKQSLTLYFMNGFSESSELLDKLGPHKTSVGCLYIKRLSDVNQNILKELIKQSFIAMKKNYLQKN